ncbi:MAG: NAD+ synthase [Gammaproteobacteria bacterium]|nr:NAD+ synthase [Gammaproteobacteria bacterium]
MKFALLQLNYIVGDIAYNANKIIKAVQSVKGKVDLCVTSELALLGYPPRDLLLHKSFLRNAEQQLHFIAQELRECPALLIGRVVPNPHPAGKPFYNAATLVVNGEIQQDFYKSLIPTYDVFDEDRYFESGRELNFFTFKDKKFGITICEDIWNNEFIWSMPRYLTNPIEKLAQHKLDAIINLSASPWFIEKQSSIREPLMSTWAKQYHLPFIYVNQVGGNDDLVFDGSSCFVNADGQLVARAKEFEEDILIVDLDQQNAQETVDPVSTEAEIFNALVCGTRDYVSKCGFKKVLLGLSGGIDSALTLVIAVKALGKENVFAVMMPSPYSSAGSIADSELLAKNLGVEVATLPIQQIMETYTKILDPVFAGRQPDVTEENLQARIRGNLLMALSNKYNSLLLTTGNKSELSVGYCTLYGDMCGGLAVISDVYKTWVYRLCQWFNESNKNEIIPNNIITKAPSAELRPDQTDQDSLPPYDVLDDILQQYVEAHHSVEEIIASGHDRETVNHVLTLFARAEFKRRQAAPGIKITNRAYGSGWRMPIAARYAF